MSGISAGSITAGKAYVLISAIDKTHSEFAKIARNFRFLRRQLSWGNSRFIGGSTEFVSAWASGFRQVQSMATNLASGVQASMMTVGSGLQFIGNRTTVAGGLSMAGVALPIAHFTSFEDAMLSMKAKLQGTQEEYKKLTEVALHHAATTSYTSVQIADAMKIMAGAGLDAGAIEQTIRPVLDSARATGTELSEMADYIMTAIRSFGGDFSEATMYADVMTTACNKTALTMTDLGYAMQYASSSGKLAGVNIREVTTLLGALANMGIRGSMAGTSLRKMFERLGVDEKKLNELGINPLDAEGNYRPIYEIITEMSAALKDIPQGKKIQILTDIFGTRGMTGVAKLTQKSFMDLVEAMEDCEGAASKTAAETDSGLGGTFRRIWSVGDTLCVWFGSSFKQAIQGAEAWIVSYIKTAGDFIATHKHVAVGVGLAAAGVTAMGISMVGVGIAVKVAASAMTVFGIVSKAVSIGLGVVHVALSLVTATLGILPAVITGIIGVTTAALTAAWAVAGIMSVITSGIVAAFAAGALTIESIGMIVSLSTLGLLLAIFPVIAALGKLQSMGRYVAADMADTFAPTSQLISNGWQATTASIGDCFTRIAQDGKACFDGVKNNAMAAFGTISMQVSQGNWTGAFRTGIAGVQVIWSQLKSFILNTLDDIYLELVKIWHKISNYLMDQWFALSTRVINSRLGAALFGDGRAIEVQLADMEARYRQQATSAEKTNISQEQNIHKENISRRVDREMETGRSQAKFDVITSMANREIDMNQYLEKKGYTPGQHPEVDKLVDGMKHGMVATYGYIRDAENDPKFFTGMHSLSDQFDKGWEITKKAIDQAYPDQQDDTATYALETPKTPTQQYQQQLIRQIITSTTTMPRIIDWVQQGSHAATQRFFENRSAVRNAMLEKASSDASSKAMQSIAENTKSQAADTRKLVELAEENQDEVM